MCRVHFNVAVSVQHSLSLTVITYDLPLLMFILCSWVSVPSLWTSISCLMHGGGGQIRDHYGLDVTIRGDTLSQSWESRLFFQWHRRGFTFIPKWLLTLDIIFVCVCVCVCVCLWFPPWETRLSSQLHRGPVSHWCLNDYKPGHWLLHVHWDIGPSRPSSQLGFYLFQHIATSLST